MRVEILSLMTTNDKSGANPADDPPEFLVGSRPSFVEIVSSHPSVAERGAEKKRQNGPNLKLARPRGFDFEIRHPIGAICQWLIAAI